MTAASRAGPSVEGAPLSATLRLHADAAAGVFVFSARTSTATSSVQPPARFLATASSITVANFGATEAPTPSTPSPRATAPTTAAPTSRTSAASPSGCPGATEASTPSAPTRCPNAGARPAGTAIAGCGQAQATAAALEARARPPVYGAKSSATGPLGGAVAMRPTRPAAGRIGALRRAGSTGWCGPEAAPFVAAAIKQVFGTRGPIRSREPDRSTCRSRGQPTNVSPTRPTYQRDARGRPIDMPPARRQNAPLLRVVRRTPVVLLLPVVALVGLAYPSRRRVVKAKRRAPRRAPPPLALQNARLLKRLGRGLD